MIKWKIIYKSVNQSYAASKVGEQLSHKKAFELYRSYLFPLWQEKLLANQTKQDQNTKA
jgi:hypothetical protein